jgi:transcriptional regulator, deoR family
VLSICTLFFTELNQLNVILQVYQQLSSIGGFMATSRSFVASRRSSIMSLLEQYRQVSVSDLADRFEVSSLTIRRDLDELEAQGLISRSYGMATLLDPLSTGLSSNQVTAKFKLAQAAAKLIKDGDTVFINTSSTAIKVLEFITAENITVVTNNGSVLAADYPPSMTVLVTGGEVRPAKKSLTGDFALASINQIRAAKCILGCSGISAERGLTTLVSNEMRVNSLMLKHSEQHIVLADASKLGVNSSFQYGLPADIDVLMTDESASISQVAALEAAGVRKVVRVGL